MFRSLLSYIIWDIDPVIFYIPWINRPIRWYGLCWLLGLIFSYQILLKIFRKEDKPIDLLDQLSWYVILGTILGARLGHVLFYDPKYYILENPQKIFAIWEGGLASHGGAIGIILSLIIFSKTKKIDFWWLADRIAIVVPLACSLIRIGNLFNSEMIGKSATVPWAFVFQNYDANPRHPAQLYESLLYLITFIVLIYLSKTTVLQRKGTLFAVMLISLFSFRFFLEEFKLNQELFEENMIFNMGQILSVPFQVFGVIILVIKNRKMGNNMKSSF